MRLPDTLTTGLFARRAWAPTSAVSPAALTHSSSAASPAAPRAKVLTFVYWSRDLPEVEAMPPNPVARVPTPALVRGAGAQPRGLLSVFVYLHTVRFTLGV